MFTIKYWEGERGGVFHVGLSLRGSRISGNKIVYSITKVPMDRQTWGGYCLAQEGWGGASFWVLRVNLPLCLLQGSVVLRLCECTVSNEPVFDWCFSWPGSSPLSFHDSVPRTGWLRPQTLILSRFGKSKVKVPEDPVSGDVASPALWMAPFLVSSCGLSSVLLQRDRPLGPLCLLKRTQPVGLAS